MSNSSCTFGLKIPFLLITFIILFSQSAKASHALGSEIRVEYVSANTFKIKLNVYRDCNGIFLPSSQSINWSAACGSGSITATRIPGGIQDSSH
ncbi:MAG: hypothetical protein ACJARP_001913 [Vicingaceae bacterium]|jgi:hypothetical protein